MLFCGSQEHLHSLPFSRAHGGGAPTCFSPFPKSIIVTTTCWELSSLQMLSHCSPDWSVSCIMSPTDPSGNLKFETLPCWDGKEKFPLLRCTWRCWRQWHTCGDKFPRCQALGASPCLARHHPTSRSTQSAVNTIDTSECFQLCTFPCTCVSCTHT